jgi:hypothetical protein
MQQLEEQIGKIWEEEGVTGLHRENKNMLKTET